jgi:hypothetical protein
VVGAQYGLPPAAQRWVACQYATDATKATVTRWQGATVSTRNDGCVAWARHKQLALSLSFARVRARFPFALASKRGTPLLQPRSSFLFF